jgi:hypothetical protein
MQYLQSELLHLLFQLRVYFQNLTVQIIIKNTENGFELFSLPIGHSTYKDRCIACIATLYLTYILPLPEPLAAHTRGHSIGL